MSTPRWPNGCSACIFLGQSGDYDLYYCVSSISRSIGTVVATARNSPHLQHQINNPAVQEHKQLQEARTLAIIQGHYDPSNEPMAVVQSGTGDALERIR